MLELKEIDYQGVKNKELILLEIFINKLKFFFLMKQHHPWIIYLNKLFKNLLISSFIIILPLS